MIVEVARDERDIQVACLADSFTIVQRLQYRQQARVFLDMTRDGIHVARTHMTRRLAPALKSCTGGCHGSIDIGAIGGCNLCQRFPIRRIDALKVLPTGGSNPLVVDKEAKGLMLLDPLQGRSSRFWRGSILHGFKNIHYVHAGPPSL